MISIIDDDAFVRESLRDLIESLGYNVAAFESAERFLNATCLAETSCLITDLQMPGFSGLDLQGRLIADATFRYWNVRREVPNPRDECRSCGLSEQAIG